MPGVVDQHLSIGEVLGLLQDEFPDVTISKIRFLESQGLIDPERTPSGYRKFYASDIDRLRWILVQQREHFLPLKVIKDRLAEGDPDDGAVTAAEAEALQEQGRPSEEPVPVAPMPEPEPAGQPIWMADLARAQASAPLSATIERPAVHLDSGPTEVSMTAGELRNAAGLSVEDLRDLEQFGLVVGRPLGDDTYYDGDALLIATKSASFMAHGIGARHLRMFKVAAEREAGFLEQLAMPLLKQRNPQARRQAVELVEELSTLGHDLRAALLRSKLRHHLDQA
ncbi:MAG: transcriptional regulator FtsR [Acidimicrobiales bacterium]